MLCCFVFCAVFCSLWPFFLEDLGKLLLAPAVGVLQIDPENLVFEDKGNKKGRKGGRKQGKGREGKEEKRAAKRGETRESE